MGIIRTVAGLALPVVREHWWCCKGNTGVAAKGMSSTETYSKNADNLKLYVEFSCMLSSALAGA